MIPEQDFAWILTRTVVATFTSTQILLLLALNKVISCVLLGNGFGYDAEDSVTFAIELVVCAGATADKHDISRSTS